MNELSSLGLILLLALLAGHFVRFLRIPEVTGYILAGVALGPSMFGWVTHDNLVALEVLSEVALGLILFSIGSVFHFARFVKLGRRILYLTFAESMLAATLVGLGLVALGQPWQVACLLGAVAMATAPASTLMVIRECNGSGPLSETLLGIIALDNILCLFTYSLVVATIGLFGGMGGPAGGLGVWYAALFPLFWQLIGSAALGYLVGMLLAGWATRVTEHGELLILLAGSILLCVGVARILELSPLIASLAVGAAMVNLSRRSMGLFDALSRTDPPFYAIFFVIAGADLDVSLVGSMGLLGIYYLVARAVGKFLGARVAARRLGLADSVQQYLGFGLMAQAGLAVGLTLAIDRQFPEYATVISAVVLSSVVIYEMVGPIATRFAIEQAGEARPDEGEPLGVLT
jgi:Kef-type K+ transport system membrane component KefB